MPKSQNNSPHQQYLERAEECRLKADAAISEIARARYLDSAERWISLAMSYLEAPKLAPEMTEQSDFRPVYAKSRY